VSAAVSGGPLSVCGGLLPPHENFKLMKLIKSDARKPGKSCARLCVGEVKQPGGALYGKQRLRSEWRTRYLEGEGEGVKGAQ
jgi:hypothetical protein